MKAFFLSWWFMGSLRDFDVEMFESFDCLQSDELLLMRFKMNGGPVRREVFFC